MSTLTAPGGRGSENDAVKHPFPHDRGSVSKEVDRFTRGQFPQAYARGITPSVRAGLRGDDTVHLVGFCFRQDEDVLAGQGFQHLVEMETLRLDFQFDFLHAHLVFRANRD